MKNEMESIVTLMNGSKTVASYRMDDCERDSHLFAIVMDCGSYYDIMFQPVGSYALYYKHHDEILSNCTYKTMRGVNNKLRRMGFAA